MSTDTATDGDRRTYESHSYIELPSTVWEDIAARAEARDADPMALVYERLKLEHAVLVGGEEVHRTDGFDPGRVFGPGDVVDSGV